MPKHTISILVGNHAGVLSRISGLFSRRGYNIDSLAVGVTENPEVSRITVVVNGDDYMAGQVEKQLNKQIDVLSVTNIKKSELIARELLLVKLYAGEEERERLDDIAKTAGAKVADEGGGSVTFELSDTTEKIDRFLELLAFVKQKEVARTGVLALQEG